MTQESIVIDKLFLDSIINNPDYAVLIDAKHPTPIERSEYFYLVHKARLASIDVNRYSDRPLSEDEHYFLSYLHNKKIDGSDIAGKWTHEFYLDYGDTISCFLGQGLIKVVGSKFMLTSKGKSLTGKLDSAIQNAACEECIMRCLSKRSYAEAYAIAQSHKHSKHSKSTYSKSMIVAFPHRISGLMLSASIKYMAGDLLLQPKNYTENEIEIIKCIVLFLSYLDLPRQSIKIMCAKYFLHADKVRIRQFKTEIQHQLRLFHSINTIELSKQMNATSFKTNIGNRDTACDACKKFENQNIAISEAVIGINFPPHCSQCQCYVDFNYPD